jgi:hypothetical protein
MLWLRSRPKTRPAFIAARSLPARASMSTSVMHARRTHTARNGASANSGVTCAVRCTTQLGYGHIWRRSTQSSTQNRSASGRARKQACGAVWHEPNLKNVKGTMCREAEVQQKMLNLQFPGIGQRPTPALTRRARMIKNIATTRIVKRWHKYSAKCSALPQQIDQEMFGGRQCTGTGVSCCSAS